MTDHILICVSSSFISLYLQANLAIQQGKHDKANRKLQAAEMLLKAKDEDLRQVQSELDAVMGEQQVNIPI